MRIAIVAPGGVGGYFGGLLAVAGEEVPHGGGVAQVHRVATEVAPDPLVAGAAGGDLVGLGARAGADGRGQEGLEDGPVDHVLLAPRVVEVLAAVGGIDELDALRHRRLREHARLIASGGGQQKHPLWRFLTFHFSLFTSNFALR